MKKKNILFLGILLVLLVLFSLGCGKNFLNNTEASDNTKANELNSGQEQIEEKGIQFPAALEEGKLEVESLFQFEGINPDADNAIGTETAAIAVKNVSDRYLDEAEITVLTDDGELLFCVTNLPAGSTVMAFELENKPLSDGALCEEINCKAVFKDDVTNIPEQILVEEDGIQINITNTSEESISKVIVYCHGPFEGEYFGGIARKYELQGLAAGETKEIIAEDFFLGVAEVVHVEIE